MRSEGQERVVTHHQEAGRGSGGAEGGGGAEGESGRERGGEIWGEQEGGAGMEQTAPPGTNQAAVHYGPQQLSDLVLPSGGSSPASRRGARQTSLLEVCPHATFPSTAIEPIWHYKTVRPRFRPWVSGQNFHVVPLSLPSGPTPSLRGSYRVGQGHLADKRDPLRASPSSPVDP